MTDAENHFTVFVRVPFNRGQFFDPQPVAWNASKEKELWEIISRQSKSNEINWKELAEKFQVTQPFLLQQAAWLYERQLSQVRAQMRKVGSRQSSNSSPIPSSMLGSTFGGQPMKQDGSGGSRVTSRLSVRARDSLTLKADATAAGAPNRIKASQPMRINAGAPIPHSRSSSVIEQRASPSVSRQAFKGASSKRLDPQPCGVGNTQQLLTQSPKDVQQSSSSTSDQSEEEKPPKSNISRRRNPSSARPKPQLPRKLQPLQSDEGGDGEDDDSSPLFLPFAAGSSAGTHHQPLDPSATLRGGFGSPPRLTRPIISRRATMESTAPNNVRPNLAQAQQRMNSSASSTSSGPEPSAVASRPPQPPASRRSDLSTRPAGPLSPRRAAELAATGLSPLRRPGSVRDGSEGSPSIGSSFSDLDEASVTQSALEEALMSNMQHGRTGGVASRMSTISQALRSRVFDQGGR